MTKRVWYISKYFAPPTDTSPGGRGFLILKEFVKNGIDVTVITSDSNNLIDDPQLTNRVTETFHDGVRLIWLKTLRYRVAKSMLRILSWLHFEFNLLFLKRKSLSAPDVVIVSSLSLLTILNGIFFKNKYKCKLVFEIRDIWPLTLTEEGGFSSSNIFVKVLSWVERYGYRHSDIVIGTMPNLQEHVFNVLGESKDVECIPMGIDSDSIKRPSNLLPENYIKEYIPENKFIVMYAGTIGITNALEVYFECARSTEEINDLHYVIVGEGALKSEFQKKYSSLKNVTFAPKVKKNQVHSVLSQADILYFSVFPSKIWNYGQSLNKLIDYMLAGKPILASYDGYPSMINEAGAGFYVPSGDVVELKQKILELMELDVNQRERMGSAGREWLIKNRKYSKISVDYLNILFNDSEEYHAQKNI